MTTITTPQPRKLLGIGAPALSWAAAELGRIPYVGLISVSVFVPYFATKVVGDPVKGQAAVALLGTISGLVAGFTAPLLGATLDAFGPRKPWLAGGLVVMAVLLFGLWFAMPGGAGLSIPVIIGMLAATKVLYSYTEVLHNSLMPLQTDRATVHRISAIGQAMGSLSSVVVMSLALWAFSLPGKVTWGWVPARPLFGLDPAKFENARIAAPIAGVMLVLGVIPLLIFSRDAPRVAGKLSSAVGDGARYLWRLPRRLKGNPDAAVYLFFRMIFADGATALTLFSGVYAAGVMHWGGLQLLIIGILRNFAGALGAMFAGWMDDVLGCKRSVQLQLLGMLTLVVAMIGTTPTKMLYLWSYRGPPISDKHLFATPPEWLFLGIMISIAFLSLALSASSRSLLSRISPKEEVGAFFGLYALAGSATAWLAPLCIGLATAAFHTQQAGIAPIAAFLAIGLAGLFLIRSRVDATHVPVEMDR